jgi:hypothetical protein
VEVGGATVFRDFTAELLMPEVLMCSLSREDGGVGVACLNTDNACRCAVYSVATVAATTISSLWGWWRESVLLQVSCLQQYLGA